MNNEEENLTNEVYSSHRVLKTDIKKDPNVEEDEIIFGCGCFWGAEKCFWKLPGVITTSVGYAGGEKSNPTYYEVCSGLTGHSEVVRVIWDKREIISYISKSDRLLRPLNMIKGTPGLGMTIIKVNTGTIGVANIMTNLFMTRTDPVFEKIPDIVKYLKLNENVNFSLVDVHGEASSEKMAIANALDGEVSAVVGTHTHVPTADHQILDKGTAYITDVGMSGDYNSIIGMNKDDALNRFLHPNNKKTRLEVSSGEPTLCAVVIETSANGLSKSINPLRLGGKLEQVFLKT